MTTQEAEREVAATARVHGLEATVAKLRTELDRAERERNSYAHRMVVAEESADSASCELSDTREAMDTYRLQAQAARQLIGSDPYQGKWAEVIARLKAEEERPF